VRDERDDCEDEQEVNKKAGYVKEEEAASPHKDKDKCQEKKH
jgi:hypothetical protein